MNFSPILKNKSGADLLFNAHAKTMGDKCTTCNGFGQIKEFLNDHNEDTLCYRCFSCDGIGFRKVKENGS